MRPIRIGLEAAVEGVVVVIDVLRAFTTAAFAFGGGAARILPVRSPEEAFELRARHPGSLLMGEVAWRKYPGFDFGNSPAEILAAEVQGRTLIQRTTAGTQALVMNRDAAACFAAGLVNARATARAVAALCPSSVTLVLTGWGHGTFPDEDEACADLVEAYLSGSPANVSACEAKVRGSAAARVFLDPSHPLYSPHDVDLAASADHFDFAMKLRSQADGLLVLTRHD